VILEWHNRRVTPILHQEILDDAKDKVEELTGLRLTNERLLKGVRSLRVLPHLKDHPRCMLTGKIKSGLYWSKIPGHKNEVYCTF
jgi:hypothetical protein